MNIHKTKRHYGTHVSPRCYNAYDYGIRETLKYNYAIQIRDWSGARTDIYKVMRVFETVFGSNWSEQPFKKLLSAAKLCDGGKEHERDAMHEQKRRVHAPALQYTSDTLKDSTWARAIEKYYGKAVMQHLIDERTRAGLSQHYLAKDSDIRKLLAIAKFIEKYDQRELKQLKRITNKPSNIYEIFTQIDDARSKGELIPQYIRDELCKDLAQLVVAGLTNNGNTLLQMKDLLAENRCKIYQLDCHASNYVSQRDSNCKAIGNMYRNYRKCKDFILALDSLQMEIANKRCCLPCNAYKISSAVYKAATTIVKSDVTLRAKQETLQRISEQEAYRAKYSRTIWTPMLQVKGEN